MPSTSWEPFWTRAHAVLFQTKEFLQHAHMQTPHLDNLHSTLQRIDHIKTSLRTLEGSVDAESLSFWVEEFDSLARETESLATQTPEAAHGFGFEIPNTSTGHADNSGRNLGGRPRIVIDLSAVHSALAMGYSLQDLARSNTGFSVKTLERRLREAGLRAKDNIPDEEMDVYVAGILDESSAAGYRYVVGALRSRGFIVTIEAVRSSLQRVDSGRAIGNRVRELPRRIRYFVPSPNSVWHFDGNHKLNRWGFVTHGCVDGYSRRIMWLNVKTNNSSSTVLGLHHFPC